MYRARILGLPVGAVGPLNGPGQGAAGDITCDLRHSRGYSQIASTSGPDTEQFDDPAHVAAVFRIIYPLPITGLICQASQRRGADRTAARYRRRLQIISVQRQLQILTPGGRVPGPPAVTRDGG